MALARLTKQCRECPFVETCEHKKMEALGYLPEPIMADVKAPVTADEVLLVYFVVSITPALICRGLRNRWLWLIN